MPKFTVECGFRNASSIPAYTSASTRRAIVCVEAADPAEARQKAIEACYEQFKGIEHVKPRTVKLVGGLSQFARDKALPDDRPLTALDFIRGEGGAS